jgi:hypothetical protein
MTQRIVSGTPIGTNLGLYHGLMTLLGGQLLVSRGALIPARSQAGLSRPAVRRAWQAMAHGAWAVNAMLRELYEHVQAQGQWHPLEVGGYRVRALDTLGFFRPRLKGCATTHYDSQADRALPALSLGILAAVGQVNGQAVTITRQVVRAEGRTQSAEALMKRLARAASTLVSEQDLITADRGFSPIMLLSAGHPHVVVRRPQNLTMRRADPPAYAGRGRKPVQGEIVRPLARRRKDKLIPATLPDAEQDWEVVEHGHTLQLSAQLWLNLRLPPQTNWTQAQRHLGQRTTWTVMVIHHPAFDQPLVVLLNLDLDPPQAYQVVRGRWGVEQPPLGAKQLLGAHRQFVYAPDMRFRLPELS